ncbi:hypothetical protein EOL94_00595 [bacterium]|nr:hypothetical protein [bacterium]
MPARKKTSTETKKEKKTVKKSSTKKTGNNKKDAKKKETKTKKTPVTKKKTSQTKKTTTNKSASKKSSKVFSEKKEKKKKEDELMVKPKRHHLEVKTLSKSSLIEPKEEEVSNVSLGFETDLKEEEIKRENIDSQKKFYKELSQELDQNFLENEPQDLEKQIEKEKEEKEKQGLRVDNKEYKVKSASLGLYRKLARLFLFLTAILILVIVYFSFSKLTITISSAEEIINNNVLLDVYNNSDIGDSLTGSVMSITAESEGMYEATGEEIIGEEVIGKVTLVNNYTKDQPLVATTRLLTQDDKLYRIKDSVTIPAGGSVEVDIYADEVKAEMAIGPTKFIIPGLWAGLQDKIYAESKEKFVYQTKIENYVRPGDITKAQEDLKSKLIKDVEKEANRMFNKTDQVIYDVNLNLTKFEYDVEAGSKEDVFDMKAESQVVVIAFPKERAEELAHSKLSLLIPQDKEIKDFDPESLSYTLDNYNLKDGVATVKVSFSGKMSLKGNADIVDRKQLVNLKKDQIEKYLDNFSEIQSFELKFFPGFVNKAPYLPEKIDIVVE